jgi:hypothetical protein
MSNSSIYSFDFAGRRRIILPKFIHNPKEFWSGVMFLFFGLAAVVIGQDYEMGSAGRMGPGYFPSVLGTLLGIIGLVSVIRSFFSQGEGVGRFAFKEGFLVLFAVFLFGMLVRGAGIILAILLMVIISSYASTKFRWTSAILLAIGAAVFCVLVFVVGLGLPMPIVGTWFGN